MTFGQIKDGIYKGLIEMCEIDKNGRKNYYDSENTNGKWYHLTYLKIKKDSVYLDMNPIMINSKKDTTHSVSDGGFYYYKGFITHSNEFFLLDLEEIDCDYCPEIIELNENGEWITIKRKKKINGVFKEGKFLLNEYLFEPEKEDRYLRSENLKLKD